MCVAGGGGWHNCFCSWILQDEHRQNSQHTRRFWKRVQTSLETRWRNANLRLKSAKKNQKKNWKLHREVTGQLGSIHSASLFTQILLCCSLIPRWMGYKLWMKYFTFFPQNSAHNTPKKNLGMSLSIHSLRSELRFIPLCQEAPGGLSEQQKQSSLLSRVADTTLPEKHGGGGCIRLWEMNWETSGCSHYQRHPGGEPAPGCLQQVSDPEHTARIWELLLDNSGKVLDRPDQSPDWTSLQRSDNGCAPTLPVQADGAREVLLRGLGQTSQRSMSGLWLHLQKHLRL